MSVAHSEGPGIAMFSHRQEALMLEMIRPGELLVGSCGNRWKSLTLIDIKTPRKTVGRLKYEIDQRGMRPTVTLKCQAGAPSLGTVGARLLPADLPLKTASGGTGCRDVIAPSGLPESSNPADGGCRVVESTGPHWGPGATCD